MSPRLSSTTCILSVCRQKKNILTSHTHTTAHTHTHTSQMANTRHYLAWHPIRSDRYTKSFDLEFHYGPLISLSFLLNNPCHKMCLCVSQYCSILCSRRTSDGAPPHPPPSPPSAQTIINRHMDGRHNMTVMRRGVLLLVCAIPHKHIFCRRLSTG